MEDADLVLVLGDPDCEGATDQVVRVAAKCSTTGTTYLEGGRSGGASRWCWWWQPSAPPPAPPT